MNSSKWLKLLALIGGGVIVNTVVFSPGLLGIQIGGDSALETASGITLSFCSLLILLYGSYVYVVKPAEVTPVKELKSREDYVAALYPYRKIKALNKELLLAIDQLGRIEKKTAALFDVLNQRFNNTELSFQKFVGVIHGVEQLFYLHLRGILNKLRVFEATEFNSVANPPRRGALLSPQLHQEKSELYNMYIAHITGYLGANEEILLKLDKLLMEISQLGSADYSDIEQLSCMKELDSLIRQTKYYEP